MSDLLNIEEVSSGTLAVVDERVVANIGVVVFPEFIAVIDTGKSPYAARRLRGRLEETYRRPVRYAFATHYHPDHTGGLSAFKDAGVVSHALVAQKMRDLPEWCRNEIAAWSEGEPSDDGRPGEIKAVAPSLLFEESASIAGDKTLELRLCGGHTDCSAYAYLAEDGVLFSGDLISVGKMPFAGDETVDPDAWIAALETWVTMDVDCVVPGHGPVAGPASIRRQLDVLNALRENAISVVKAGKEPSAIALPEGCRVEEGKEWFIDATVARWHAYYLGQAGI